MRAGESFPAAMVYGRPIVARSAGASPPAVAAMRFRSSRTFTQHPGAVPAPDYVVGCTDAYRDLFPDDDLQMLQGTPSLLLVDADTEFARAVVACATAKGFVARLASGWHEAERMLRATASDLVLLDITLADDDGLKVLERMKASQRARVVVVTANPSAQSAAIALQHQVLDYMVKPLAGRRLHELVERAAVIVAARRHGRAGVQRCGELLAQSDAMIPVFATLHRLAPMQHTVLLHGESGTGKDLAARALHKYSGRRGSFVAVNCGALAELAGSQLFGHVRGSFTGAVADHAGFFEQAHAGTLFLDEFTEMPAHIQTYLLRVLEEHVVTRLGSRTCQSLDVRVIAASNRDPQLAVQNGTLRADLYYRLSEFAIFMPPLRVRKGDVGVLAQHFLEQLNRQHGWAHQLSSESLARLEAHRWPGNVRELRHVIGRAHVMAESPLLDAWPDLCTAPLASDLDIHPGQTLDDIERKAILLTLDHFGSDRARAAQALGISVKTLYNKLARYRHEDGLDLV